MAKRLPNIISKGYAKLINDEVRQFGVLPLEEAERFWLAKACKVGLRQVDLWTTTGKLRRPFITSRIPFKITDRDLFALEPHLRVRAVIGLGIMGHLLQQPDDGYDPKTYIERRRHLWEAYSLIDSYLKWTYSDKYLREHWTRIRLKHNPDLIDPVTDTVTGGWEIHVTFFYRYKGDAKERRAARARERRRERNARERERARLSGVRR